MTFFNEDTVGAVSKIVSMLDEADMAKLQEKYGSLTASAGEIAERIESWISFGKSYKIFTSAPDDMTTSVFFVYMTPSIEKDRTSELSSVLPLPTGRCPPQAERAGCKSIDRGTVLSSARTP